MISISKDANPNYLAKVVELKGLRPHPNADRLQVVTIDFQDVITDLYAKDGDIYVYFPLESQINEVFLSATNAYRDKQMNFNKEVAGFFESNGRVRAVKLRGQKSMGYMVPSRVIEEFSNDHVADCVGQEFDTIGEYRICKKYFVKQRELRGAREGKKPRISRLIDGQVRLHVDTENFRKSAFEVQPDDMITVTYKTHGTSWWVANILVKKKLNFFWKLASKIFPVQTTEYDYVYGSRKVVKNEYETSDKEHFYDSDIWGEIKDDVKDFIPKGYTLYGEALGYTKSGAEIQKGYDYGCEQGNRRLQIYRITSTNEDGIVHDLSSLQVKEFCERFGLEYVHVFYHGKAKDLFPELDTENHWHENFMKRLEETYNDKDCFMCKNKVPEEGIVIRKETLFEFRSYKLKSFRFYEYETALLDAGESDIESEN